MEIGTLGGKVTAEHRGVRRQKEPVSFIGKQERKFCFSAVGNIISAASETEQGRTCCFLLTDRVESVPGATMAVLFHALALVCGRAFCAGAAVWFGSAKEAGAVQSFILGPVQIEPDLLLSSGGIL